MSNVFSFYLVIRDSIVIHTFTHVETVLLSKNETSMISFDTIGDID
jgi:hypothetical protein